MSGSLPPRLVAPLALVVLTACVTPPGASPPAPRVSDELRRARAFDQQGVNAFAAGRYHDALLYFDAAFAHGGPPSERWNAAKCHLHVDESEQGEADLVAYLALPGLTADDKREATALLETLRSRPSMLTVTSVPLDRPVFVDGRRVGVTPISVAVSPGEHVVLVDRVEARDERHMVARLGRAVLVEARP
jgi:hypothetical protein